MVEVDVGCVVVVGIVLQILFVDLVPSADGVAGILIFVSNPLDTSRPIHGEALYSFQVHKSFSAASLLWNVLLLSNCDQREVGKIKLVK